MAIICFMDKLPPEIFWPIVKRLRLKDISALSRCDRQNYNFFNPVLYSLDAKRPDRWALQWATIYNVLSTASTSLAAGSPPNQYCDMRLATPDRQDIFEAREFGGTAVTPLDIAIRYNYDDMVALLISHGCELSTHPASWLYGLNEAIVNGRRDWVQLYDSPLKAHATSDENKMDKFLIKAMYHNQHWAFHYLLGHVLPSDRSFIQYLVFEAAACAGSLTWVKDLYEMDFLTSFDKEAIQKLWFKVARMSTPEHGTLVFDYLAQQYPWLDEFRYSDEESDSDDEYDSYDDGFDNNISPRRKMDVYFVCRNGNLAMTKRLLGLGASPRWVKDDVWPLVEAMEAGNYEMVQLLLDNGAELVLEHFRKTGEYDVLLQACRCGNTDILELLIQRGATVGDDGESECLRWAIRGGHLRMIQYWVSQGHQVPADALHSFFKGVYKSQKAWQSAPETARFLIEAGAEVDIAIDNHGTPFCTFTDILFWVKDKLAETERDVSLELAKVLVSSGADCMDIFQQNFSTTAVSYANKDFLQFLLDQPCIVDVKAESWFLMLNDARFTSDEAWFSTLIEYMIQHNMWTGHDKLKNRLIGNVCHHWNDKTRGARYRLLSKLVRPDMGTEPTWVFVIFDNNLPDLESLRLLLAYGLDVQATHFYGVTPLHFACGKGHTAVVRILLEAGANVAAKDERGRTPMDMALAYPTTLPRVHYPFVGVFELLLMHGSPLGSKPITNAGIDAKPGFRQLLDKYVSKKDLDKWLAMT